MDNDGEARGEPVEGDVAGCECLFDGGVKEGGEGGVLWRFL